MTGRKGVKRRRAQNRSCLCRASGEGWFSFRRQNGLRELGDQRLAHLYKMPGLQRAACATAFSGGNFSDHCAAYIIGISQHQVEVMVAMFASFLLPAKQYRFHGIDLLLRAGTLVTE